MKGKKILYFDCSSGISGDMTLGALLDLADNNEAFLEELRKLHLDGWRIEFETVERNAICANHVKVILEEQSCHHHHGEQEDHGHVHRTFRDIRAMILESELKEEVKDLSLRIFGRVAEAEAKVHGKSMEEVHFHEVGAVDSIVDIVGCAILVSMIKPEAVYASVVQDGCGFITCRHGQLSVPVPAVSEIFAAASVAVRQINVETELVTPTGAAIIAELAESFGTMPAMEIEKIGWGAGTKILPIPNVLKVYQGGEVQEENSGEDEILVLETNLDDCTGEMLGYAMERLLEAGALDVFYAPIYMKKNRPAYRLTVLTRPEEGNKMEEILFHHTTTIGIRRRKEERSILPRKKSTLSTPYGDLEMKKVFLKDGERNYPEYESAVKLAEEKGVSLWEIYRELGIL